MHKHWSTKIKIFGEGKMCTDLKFTREEEFAAYKIHNSHLIWPL